MRAKINTRNIFIVLSFVVFSHISQARDVTVFAVNKNLQMNPKDVVLKDYYINGGVDDGLRKGMVVTIIRRTPVHDLSRNKALGDIHLPVAKIKLIYVQKTLSIGRLHALVQGNNIPNADYGTVMVGDKISFTDGADGSGVDTGELETIKSSEETEAPAPAPAPAPTGTDASTTEKNTEKTDGNKADAPPASPPEQKPTETPPPTSTQSPRNPSSAPKITAPAPEKNKKVLKSEAKPDTNPPAVLGPAT